MGNQVSKRGRSIRKVQEIKPVLDGYSGTKLDNRLWIYRRVSSQSVAALQEASSHIRGHEAARKRGAYTLSLLYPSEVHLVTRRSVLRGHISVRRVEDMLVPLLPSSIQLPVEAETRGLRQYHGAIGLEVSYPEFDEERRVIIDGLNRILGIKYRWEIGAHITIARGNLAKLSNLEQIETALPLVLHLAPAESGFNIQG